MGFLHEPSGLWLPGMYGWPEESYTMLSLLRFWEVAMLQETSPSWCGLKAAPPFAAKKIFLIFGALIIFYLNNK